VRLAPRGAGRRARLAKAGVYLGAGGLAVTAGMLLAIGASGALNIGLLNNGETALSAAGTLVASISTLVAVPVGLVVMGLAVARDHQVDAVTRPLMLIATLLLAGAPVIVLSMSGIAEGRALAGWAVVVGVVWAVFALRLRQRLPLAPGATRSPLATG